MIRLNNQAGDRKAACCQDKKRQKQCASDRRMDHKLLMKEDRDGHKVSYRRMRLIDLS